VGGKGLSPNNFAYILAAHQYFLEEFVMYTMPSYKWRILERFKIIEANITIFGIDRNRLEKV